MCGPETYSLACNLVAPAKPGDKPFEELVTEHYSPQPSIIVQRFKFHSRYRKQGESIVCYIADLRQIAKLCEFKDALNDMLRDQLVCGVNDRAIQRRLLSESALTLKKAFDTAQCMESASRDIQELHISTDKVVPPPTAVEKVH